MAKHKTLPMLRQQSFHHCSISTVYGTCTNITAREIWTKRDVIDRLTAAANREQRFRRMQCGDAGSGFRDIDGLSVGLQNLVTDADGNSYDVSQLRQSDGIWYYKEKPLGLHRVDGAQVIRLAVDWQADAWDFEVEEDARKHEVELLKSPISPAPNYDAPSTLNCSHERLLRTADRSQVDGQGQIDHNVHPTTFELDHTTIFSRLQKYVEGRQPGLHLQHEGAYYGYEAETLIDSVAMHCRPCRSSSLTGPNSLHLFNRRNFCNISDTIYQAMQPGIALAERLILQGSLHFWITVYCGEREYRHDSASGVLREVLYPKKQYSGAEIDATIQQLKQLEASIRFSFETVDGGYARSMKASHGSNDSLTRDPFQEHHYITIDGSLFHSIKRYAQLRHPDPAAKLRLNFFLAVVLCHELAHALETKCGDYRYLKFLQARQLLPGVNNVPERTHEAFWEGDENGEAGAKWEIMTFGDRIKPINHGCDIRYGLILYNGDWFDCNLFGKDTRLRTAQGKHNSLVVSMGYIEEIQQATYWSQSEHHNLRPPLFGPRNIFIGTDTSTMSWRQFLLDKEIINDNLNDDSHIDIYMHDSVPGAAGMPTIKRQSQRTKINQLFQTPIQAFSSGFNHDAKTVWNAMRVHAENESSVVAAQRAAVALQEERNRQYKEPPSGQPDIHRFFRYSGSPNGSTSSVDTDQLHDAGNPRYDALNISPDRLRMSDKWILTEELFCLSERSDSATFLARRAAGHLGLAEHSSYHPRNPASWKQTQMDVLRQLREQYPDKAFPAIEAKKHQARQGNKLRWQTINRMEELCVYMGYSRIEFERSFAEGKPLPLGMTVDNFETRFGEILLQKRLEWEAHQDTGIDDREMSRALDITLVNGLEQEDFLNDVEDAEHAPHQSTLDKWLATFRPATVNPLSDGQSKQSGIPMQLDDPVSTKTFDKAQYNLIQRAAVNGKAGLYSFLKS